HAHLDRVGRRTFRLLFERRCAAVPELGGQERGVEYRGRVASALLSVDADRRRPVIVAALSQVVARETRDRAGRREPGVEVEHLAELDFRRRRGVVGRLRSNLGERLPECFIRDGYRGRKACRGEHRLQLHRAIPPWICRMTSRLVRRVNVSPRGAGRVDTQTYLPAQTYFPGLTPISTNVFSGSDPDFHARMRRKPGLTPISGKPGLTPISAD